MAGTLLLIRKEKQSKENFTALKQSIKKYIAAEIAPHFKKIEYDEPGDRVFLVGFRKDDRPKYYKHSDGSWLLLEGWAFALDETKVFDAGALFRLYRNQEEDFVKQLDGQFVIKLYDARTDKYLIISDHLKNQTNFWVETGDYFFFSTFLILSAFIKEPELDRYAFNEYMWRYYIMSHRTMLQGVERIKAARIYSIMKDQIGSRRYWDWPKAYTDMKFEEAASRLMTSLGESARLIEKAAAKPIVELTMGQDSRTIAAAFLNQKIRFVSAIYGKDDFLEVEKVRDMSMRYGLENHHIKLQESFVNNPWETARKDIILSSAEQPVYLIGRIMHMRRQYLPFGSLAVNGVHGRFYKDGTWNELYVMNLYREPKKLRHDTLIKYRMLNKNYRDDIFTSEMKQIKARSREYMIALFEQAVKGLELSPVAIQVDKFDAENYAAYGQAGNSACNLVLDLLSPLLYRRNLELALAMPASWKYNLSRLQRAVVDGLYPPLALEKTDMGLNMKPRSALTMPFFLMHYWYIQSQKFRDKLKNRLGIGGSETHLQKAWDYLPIYQAMFGHEQVQEILNGKNMVIGKIIEKSAWDRLLEEYKDVATHKLNKLEYILKILTVEYFLQEAGDIHTGIKN